MAKTSKYWDKRAIQRLNRAEKTSEEYIQKVKKMYDRAYRELNKEIENIYKNYSNETGVDVKKLKQLLTEKETSKVFKELKKAGFDQYIQDNYKSRITRLEQLKAQIYSQAKKVYDKEELINNECYKDVLTNSYYRTIYDTQMGTGYDFNFNTINKHLLDTVLNEKWSGKNYSQRIWGNTDILANSVSEIIGAGLLNGQSIARTSKLIRDRYNVSQYYAERLVRTESNHFHNEADAMAYEEMGIDKYVFVAVLDNRTSEMCQEQDNKVFDYKDREVGVNYPPLHPQCRSTTRGYLGEEAEKTLQRRARNPITGQTEVIDNVSYKDWAKNNGLVNKMSPKSDKKTNEKVDNLKKVPKNGIINIRVSDLPKELQDKKELKNSNTLIEYINNSKTADPKVKQVYSLMGKAQNVPIKVSHASDSSISYKQNRLTGNISEFKLTTPKLDNVNDVGNINIALHENMHFIDFMSGNKGYGKLYTSLNETNLLDIVKNTDASMSDKVSDLFKGLNDKSKELSTNIQTTYDPKFNTLNNKFKANNITYTQYMEEWKKLKKEYNQEYKQAEIMERNFNGGGINNLQDIYDALSGGLYRDTNKVIFGHGSKYYRNYDSRVKEIVANYGTLSISRPDLIKLLKEDKPALVNELDKLMDIIIEKYK